jgi:hypothetical protein
MLWKTPWNPANINFTSVPQETASYLTRICRWRLTLENAINTEIGTHFTSSLICSIFIYGHFNLCIPKKWNNFSIQCSPISEIHWFKRSSVWFSGNSSRYTKTDMEHWWNDTERLNPNRLEKHFSHFHYVDHIYSQNYLISNPALRSDRPATNRANHSTAQED